MPSPADLFLSPDLTETQARAYLQSLGFRDPAAADDRLQSMAGDLVVREALGRLAPDLIAALVESPDPDAALAAVAQYVAARSGRAMFLDYLREDPRALHVLTCVMGASPPLGDILVRTPEYFHWLVSQVERSAPDRQDHDEELVSALAAVAEPAEALTVLRRWKQRELLRIGARYLLSRDTVQTASAQLADVAAAVLDFALAAVTRRRLDADGRTRPPGAFAIIATGALGGREMSYDPEIHLLYVYDTSPVDPDRTGSAADFFAGVARELTAALADDTHEGTLYRVVLPAWPQTGGSSSACSLREFAELFAASNDPAGQLALTRARPIAGDVELGARFIAACQSILYREPGWTVTAEWADRVQEEGLTIERLTQMLQLVHGPRHPALRQTGTLGALDELGRAGLLSEELCRELDRAFVFLHSAEHRRQLGLRDDVQKQVEASRERVREICRTIRRLEDW